MRQWLISILALAIPAGAQAPSTSPGPPAAVDRVPIALLVDLSSGQTLYARDAERRFLPASMTKAMTALVAFDLIAAGKLDENQIVQVRPETAQRWSGRGASLSLRAGERIIIRELLLATTTASANDAAVVLAESATGSLSSFVALMNERARRLGMSGSHFASVNGLPDGGATYVTARDLVRLGAALTSDHPALYRRYMGQRSFAWREISLHNHDPLVGTFSGADGIKTGHTFEAGFNHLGSAARDGRRLVFVTGGARTETDRANASRALANWGFEAWRLQGLAPAGWVVGSAKVQGGNRRNVSLAIARPLALAFSGAKAPKVAATIRYTGPLRAPIAKGATVARLELRPEGMAPFNVPLIAAEDVDRAGAIDRIVNALLGLVS